jgi:hypothetical protein
VSPGSGDGVAEPDPDRGDVDGALVDTFSLVVSGGDGAEGFELVEAAFHGVAVLVPLGVEGGWPAAGRAAVAAMLFLVFLDRDDRSDTTSAR